MRKLDQFNLCLDLVTGEFINGRDRSNDPDDQQLANCIHNFKYLLTYYGEKNSDPYERLLSLLEKRIRELSSSDACIVTELGSCTIENPKGNKISISHTNEIIQMVNVMEEIKNLKFKRDNGE